MNLRAFVEQVKMNWTDVYFTPDSGTAYYCPFAIKPSDFITFAKADFFKADTRGLVNALSNAKRAIDCQADSFIASIGLDPERLDKQLGANGVASLSFGAAAADGPLKFRFLQALGIATPAIIARMRRLRNLLEHEYKKPRKIDVSDAIGVAELFVQACHGKMQSPMESFGFGTGATKARGSMEVAKEFHIWFSSEPVAHFDVSYRDREWMAKHEAERIPEIEVGIRDEGFVPLLKLMWRAEANHDMTEPLRNFLTELGVKLSPSKFRVRDSIVLE